MSFIKDKAFFMSKDSLRNMARTKNLKNLPKCIGVYGDPNYPNRLLISNLIGGAPRGTTVAISEGGKTGPYIQKLVLQRGDLFCKLFLKEDWQSHVTVGRKAEALRDYMFLSYVNFHKGILFLFAEEYEPNDNGMIYTPRTQDFIIMAHTLSLPYEVIRPIREEVSDDEGEEDKS